MGNRKAFKEVLYVDEVGNACEFLRKRRVLH